MYLKKIKITNYRSCFDTEFELDSRLSALIGPNGTGKTNILTGIRLLRSLLFGGHRNFSPEEQPAKSISTIKSWFDLNDKVAIHTGKLNLYTDEHNRDEIISSDEKWYMRDFTGNRKLVQIPLETLGNYGWRNRQIYYIEKANIRKQFMRYDRSMRNYLFHGHSSKVLNVLSEISDFITNIKYYSASQFTDPSSCPISFEVEEDDTEQRGISLSGHNRFLFDMYQEFRKKAPSYDTFISLVNGEGLGLIDYLKFEEIEVSSSEVNVMTGAQVRKYERKKILIVPQIGIGKSKLSPNQLSEGTFKSLALIFYLVTERSSFLMIEEPEVCIHHGLLSSILELIKIYSKEKQIIITTHSDAVLDELEIRNVFKITKDNLLGTKVVGLNKSMKSKELKALKNYLDSEGTLGEYWRFGDLEDE